MSGNKHVNSGCTAFYSVGGPSAQIFIGAPFSWDCVRAGAGCMCIGCSSHSRVQGKDGDLPASGLVASGGTRVKSSSVLDIGQ